MDKRNVVVILRDSPLNSVRNSEALRHCVGLTLGENQVTAVLLDAAAWLARPMFPSTVGGGELKKPIDTLRLLKMRVLVEKESLSAWRVDEGEVSTGIEVVSSAEVVD
ncbi:MAG: hypothetical protein EPO21_13530, partial [Chloroflexota bacterium]